MLLKLIISFEILENMDDEDNIDNNINGKMGKHQNNTH
jgi:hypothetical protein